MLKCNRSACETGLPATWWNSSTRAFYCATCARQINRFSPGLCVERVRDARQGQIYDWVRRTFGTSTLSATERALRFIEEALELVQAQGIPAERVRAVLDHVYGKPPGSINQEVGGVGVTLLGYCAACGISADAEEFEEMRRVFAIDPAHFRQRHDVKARAGIASFSNAGSDEEVG